MRIWVSTENSRGPEISPDGGRRDTSSFQAGFKLTEETGEILITKFMFLRKSQAFSAIIFQNLLVKTIRRMIAMSIKRNWKSPRLLDT